MKDDLTIRSGGICDYCGCADESIHIHPCERCGMYMCKAHILQREHRCKPRCMTCKRFLPYSDVREGFWECLRCDPARDEPWWEDDDEYV